MRFFYSLLLILFCNLVLAQNDRFFITPMRPIDKAFFKHDFETYKELYRKEYFVVDTSTLEKKRQYIYDIYVLAEILAYENITDSAINIISRIINRKEFDNYDNVLGCVGYLNIHSDKWDIVKYSAYNLLLNKCNRYNNSSLCARLLILKMTDQSNMLYNQGLFEKQKFFFTCLADSIVNIFTKNGYPRLSDVGKDAAEVPVLILAHADIKTQLKYKDFIYNSAIRGYIPGGMGGVFLDKIQVKQKGTQIYGTQYRVGKNSEIIFYPIEDIENLDKRRKDMGFIISYENYREIIENQD